jgi:tetrahydromethanopterin S-methyltransferase subunit E
MHPDWFFDHDRPSCHAFMVAVDGILCAVLLLFASSLSFSAALVVLLTVSALWHFVVWLVSILGNSIQKERFVRDLLERQNVRLLHF